MTVSGSFQLLIPKMTYEYLYEIICNGNLILN